MATTKNQRRKSDEGNIEHPWRWQSVRAARRSYQNEGGTARVVELHVTSDGRVKVGQR